MFLYIPWVFTVSTQLMERDGSITPTCFNEQLYNMQHAHLKRFLLILQILDLASRLWCEKTFDGVARVRK